MLTAKEAFDLSVKNLEPIETIDELLTVEQRIKEAIEKGFLVTRSDPMSAQKAEKLGIELEEFGYATNVVFSGMMTENKEPLCCVEVNWRYIPRNSHVALSESTHNKEKYD